MPPTKTPKKQRDEFQERRSEAKAIIRTICDKLLVPEIGDRLSRGTWECVGACRWAAPIDAMSSTMVKALDSIAWDWLGDELPGWVFDLQSWQLQEPLPTMSLDDALDAVRFLLALDEKVSWRKRPNQTERGFFLGWHEKFTGMPIRTLRQIAYVEKTYFRLGYALPVPRAGGGGSARRLRIELDF